MSQTKPKAKKATGNVQTQRPGPAASGAKLETNTADARPNSPKTP
jgi:hypothetical protein